MLLQALNSLGRVATHCQLKMMLLLGLLEKAIRSMPGMDKVLMTSIGASIKRLNLIQHSHLMMERISSYVCMASAQSMLQAYSEEQENEHQMRDAMRNVLTELIRKRPPDEWRQRMSRALTTIELYKRENLRLRQQGGGGAAPVVWPCCGEAGTTGNRAGDAPVNEFRKWKNVPLEKGGDSESGQRGWQRSACRRHSAQKL